MFRSKLNNESLVGLREGINSDDDRAGFVFARIIECADRRDGRDSQQLGEARRSLP